MIAAPLVGAELDAGHVLQQHGGPVLGLHHDVADVVGPAQVAAAAHDELELGEFDGSAADVGIAGPHDVADLVERDSEVAHPLRVNNNVVLLDEAADARNLRHALRLRQTELQVPVLHRPGLGKVPAIAGDGVLVGPAHARGVRTEGRRDAVG